MMSILIGDRDHIIYLCLENLYPRGCDFSNFSPFLKKYIIDKHASKITFLSLIIIPIA